ncbi:MAG: tetratricopeptide repeat protein [Bdellovibrionales bacterium]
MLSVKTISLLILCATTAACAGASPEDAKMSLALSAQGKALLAEGKKAEARDVYVSAVSRNDRNARAWNGLGVSYELLGKRSEARDAYKRAIELAPNDMTAANNLAHLYMALGAPEDAVELLEPLARKKNAPEALKQNFAKAFQMVRDEDAQSEDPYADLGTFPTKGLAEGGVAKAKALMGNPSGLSYEIVPDVKASGGTPSFTIKARGASPQSICGRLNPKAFSCIPRGRK